MLSSYLCFLACHFFTYVLALRNLACFRKEKVVFLYHALPGLMLAAAAGAACWLNPDLGIVAKAVLIIAIQGIYSLTFLEFWSLAQGGYSLTILAQLEDARRRGMAMDCYALADVGASKKAERVASLIRLGLVAETSAGFTLTRKGRSIGRCLDFIVRLANVRNEG